MSSVHAFGGELSRLDAVATAALVRARRVSPEEVVAAAIERAELVDGQLHAIATPDFDRALDAARRASTHGALAGVPTFIKDGTDVAGLPTRQGSASLRGASPAKATHPIAQQLLDMGTIALGKSTLPEFGFTPSTEFPDGSATANPWNTGRSAGGSSGGSAALVAAGVVPIAHGQDGGGSVRIPAACNGLVGLKPTRGRLLPAPEDRLLPVKIVADGVLTRTVRDTIAYYREAELRFRPTGMAPIGDVTPIDRPLRIGASLHTPIDTEIDEATREAFADAVTLLESLGHRVEELPLPIEQEFADDFVHYWAMLCYVVQHQGAKLYDPSFDRHALLPVTQGLAARFRRDWKRTPGAIRRLRRSNADFVAGMSGCDVVLTPTLAHLPPELGWLGVDLPYETLFPRVERWVTYSPLANATGAPAISLPLGHDPASNLPVGMMFSGRFGDDALLLRLALQLEAAEPFPTLAEGTPA